MTRAEFLEFHKKACEKMHSICQNKNHDYAGPGTDAFSNFTNVEAIGFATTEQGFLTRMLDKFCRLSTFCQTKTLLVKDESVTDTLLDLANYCILLAGYLESRKHEK